MDAHVCTKGCRLDEGRKIEEDAEDRSVKWMMERTVVHFISWLYTDLVVGYFEMSSRGKRNNLSTVACGLVDEGVQLINFAGGCEVMEMHFKAVIAQTALDLPP